MAGNVGITATESIILSDSVIDTFTTGMGNAGTVSVEAKTVSLVEGTEIQAHTLGRGRAGEIFVAAGDSLNLEWKEKESAYFIALTSENSVSKKGYVQKS